MSRTRVILVDDHTLFRKSLRSLLEGTEIVVVVGEADGADGLMELLDSVEADVILMDLNLGTDAPDGIEATRRLKSRFANLPVLLLTMYDAREVMTEAARAGVTGYVLKDSEPDELISAISAVARGSGWMSPSIALKAMSEMAVVKPEAPAPSPEGREDRFGLTPRELEVMALLVDGYTYPEVAKALFVSDSQVKQHMARILEKLGARSKAHAVAIALSEGVVRKQPQ